MQSDNAKCPYCGADHYTINAAGTMYWKCMSWKCLARNGEEETFQSVSCLERLRLRKIVESERAVVEQKSDDSKCPWCGAEKPLNDCACGSYYRGNWYRSENCRNRQLDQLQSQNTERKQRVEEGSCLLKTTADQHGRMLTRQMQNEGTIDKLHERVEELEEREARVTNFLLQAKAQPCTGVNVYGICKEGCVDVTDYCSVCVARAALEVIL